MKLVPFQPTVLSFKAAGEETPHPIHPSENKRKRWRALNAILREKRAKITTDGESSSYVARAQVEPIYKPLIEPVIIKPKPVPDNVVEDLYEHLRMVNRGLG